MASVNLGYDGLKTAKRWKMAKRYTEAENQELEQNLIRDIRAFVPLFHRKPSPEEVMDWAAGIYNHNTNGFYDGWAKGLIDEAIGDLDIHKNHHKSSFELYGIENKCPALCLGDFKPSEMVGICDD